MPDETPTTHDAPTAPSMRAADIAPPSSSDGILPPPPSTDPQIPGQMANSLDALRVRIEEHIIATRSYQERSEKDRKDTASLLGALAGNALKQNLTVDAAFGAVQGAMTMASEALAAVKVMATSGFAPPPPQPFVPRWMQLAVVAALFGILFVLVILAAQH